MIKNCLILFAILLLVISCNQSRENNVSELTKNEKKSRETKNQDTNSIEANKTESNILISTIIEKSNKRKIGKVNINKRKYQQNKIEDDFVKKYLTGFKVKNIEDFNTEFDPYSRYYFFDYSEFDDFILFTIIHDDEVGYDNFYHYTYDKIKNQIVDVTLIASIGGDGGHSQEDSFFYSKSCKELIVKSKSLFDEDLFDEEHKDCFYRITDIYETRYNFEKKMTKIMELKSNTSKDTICVVYG